MNLKLYEEQLNFWSGMRVFVTGHTGFKGTWLVRILLNLGADVTGYALAAPSDPDFFVLAGLEGRMASVIGDIRDFEAMNSAFCRADPEVAFHLAAQPLVRESYERPTETYAVNVMGTANFMECVRKHGGVKSVVNVTTDKVYENTEWVWGYREIDQLGGHDPYSSSKACSELVTSGYARSFFQGGETAESTVRAGNVIGGGDFSADRIVPDCIRAALKDQTITIRNQHAVRPYQHVLEALFAYMLVAQHQYSDPSLAGSYNIGPEEADCLTAGEVADLFCRHWGGGQNWRAVDDAGPREAVFLKLDCSRMKAAFAWRPLWTMDVAMQKTVTWVKGWRAGRSIGEIMDDQIAAFVAAKD